MNYQQSWKDKIAKKPLRFRGSSDSRTRHGGLSWKNFFLQKAFLKALLILILAGFVLAAAGFAWLSRDLPNPKQLMNRQVAQSTKIYDRTGQNILYDIHGDEQRTMIELKDLPNYVKQATIAIEDKNFYQHKGFSLLAIARTIVTNVVFHKKAGASTLTQQFVKNAILSSEKTYTRKIKELILAYRLEKKFSKDQILQMYLNEIPYGSTAYGIEAASRRYFAKSAKDLTLPEAAILASIPQAPSYYSPYSGHKDALLARQKYVLSQMAEQGYITKEEADKAKKEEIKFAPPSANMTAPHFVMYVKELLTETYGQKMVEQGGLKIYTTLDLDKQKIAEEAVKNWWEANKQIIKDKNGSSTEVNKFGASNAALVSIDPKNGQVLAMVGSRDYFNDEIDGQVNIATAPLQPGSSLKPLVYAALFNKGFTPDSILYDVVTNFSSDKNKPYEPKNYNLKEYGPVKIRQALAGSLNIPAVKATYLAGLESIVALAQKFGYTTLNDKERFGLSIALGGAEVKLLEHTNAYGVFARGGIYHPAAAILKVEDKDGKILEEWKLQEEKVLDENVAQEITSILSDNSARAFVFGEKNYLTLPGRAVAAKTGTTNDYKDAWTMGYTPSIATGVWVGNNDRKEMKKGSSASMAAAPIWNEYMKKVLNNTPVETFKEPEIKKTGKAILDGQVGEQIVKIDSSTGLLATEFTPPELIEEKIFKQPHCILFYVDKDDPLGPAPADPGKDPQYAEWEKRVQDWAIKQMASSSASSSQFFIIASGSAPTNYDNVHIPANKPTVKINKPANNDFITTQGLTTDIFAEAPRGIARVRYYLNNNLFAERSGHFFNLENQPIDFLSNGYHNLKVQACDDVGNCAETSVEINLILDENAVKPEFTTTLAWPQSGLALNRFDFPINIKFESTNPAQVAKIEVYSKKGGKQTLLGATAPAGNVDAVFVWKAPKEAGEYRLFGKAYGWGGQVKETAEIILTINQ